MAPFEALYGWKCRTPLYWNELDEALIIRPEPIQENAERGSKNSRTFEKSYVDQRRRSLEFQVGVKVLLKVSPVKGEKRFNVRGKLNPRYIGPYDIIEKLNPVFYQLNLPTKLEHMHNVFHIFQL